MLKIGIAGYMGSGKSTFSDYFSSKGATVFDADRIAKEFMNKSPEIKILLAKEFGDSILSKNKIQFNVLGKICFASESNLLLLNGIVHKPLIKYLHKLLRISREKICVLDAALIPLWQVENWFDILYWIQAPEAVRLKRLSQKVTLPISELKKRMELQEALFKEPSEKQWNIISNENSINAFLEVIHKQYENIKKFHIN